MSDGKETARPSVLEVLDALLESYAERRMLSAKVEEKQAQLDAERRSWTAKLKAANAYKGVGDEVPLRSILATTTVDQLSKFVGTHAGPDLERAAVEVWRFFLTEMVIRTYIVWKYDPGWRTLPTRISEEKTNAPYVEGLLRFCAYSISRLQRPVLAAHSWDASHPISDSMLFEAPHNIPQSFLDFPYINYASDTFPSTLPSDVLLTVQVESGDVAPAPGPGPLCLQLFPDIPKETTRLSDLYKELYPEAKVRLPLPSHDMAESISGTVNQMGEQAARHLTGYGTPGAQAYRSHLGLLTTLEHSWFLWTNAEGGWAADPIRFPFFNLIQHMLVCHGQQQGDHPIATFLERLLDAENMEDKKKDKKKEDTKKEDKKQKSKKKDKREDKKKKKKKDKNRKDKKKENDDLAATQMEPKEDESSMPFGKLAIGEAHDIGEFPNVEEHCKALFSAATTNREIQQLAMTYLGTFQDACENKMTLSWDEAPLLIRALMVLPLSSPSGMPSTSLPLSLRQPCSPSDKPISSSLPSKKRKRQGSNSQDAPEPKRHPPGPQLEVTQDSDASQGGTSGTQRNSASYSFSEHDMSMEATDYSDGSGGSYSTASTSFEDPSDTEDRANFSTRNPVLVECDRILKGDDVVPKGVFATFSLHPFPYQTAISDLHGKSGYLRLAAMGFLESTCDDVLRRLALRYKSGLCVKLVANAEEYETEVTTLVYAAKKKCRVTPRVVCCGSTWVSGIGSVNVIVTDFVGYPLFCNFDTYEQEKNLDIGKWRRRKPFKKWLKLQSKPKGVPKLWSALLEALKELHRCRIVNGDLKPDHFMVDPVDGTIKIIDFGSSEVVKKIIFIDTHADAYKYGYGVRQIGDIHVEYKRSDESHPDKAQTDYYTSPRRFSGTYGRAIPSDDVASTFSSLIWWLAHHSPTRSDSPITPPDEFTSKIHMYYHYIPAEVRRYLDPIAQSVAQEMSLSGNPRRWLVGRRAG